VTDDEPYDWTHVRVTDPDGRSVVLTADEWRTRLHTVRHTLIGNGSPFHHREDDEDRDGPIGRALCSCLWQSAILPTDDDRKQAHAQHVTEIKEN
jgi:hypothetical protein